MNSLQHPWHIDVNILSIYEHWSSNGISAGKVFQLCRPGDVSDDSDYPLCDFVRVDTRDTRTSFESGQAEGNGLQIFIVISLIKLSAF